MRAKVPASKTGLNHHGIGVSSFTLAKNTVLTMAFDISIVIVKDQPNIWLELKYFLKPIRQQIKNMPAVKKPVSVIPL
jgi:hypothetical protein